MTEDQIRFVVKEAVAEALKGANLIDGPTHIKHHQMLDEFIVLLRHAKKTGVGAIVIGLFVLLALGFTSWVLGRG